MRTGEISAHITVCLSDNSAASHELKNLLGVLRLAVSYDQIDCSNLASIEQVVRRIIEIQTAVRRNPKHPTFDSFDYNTRGSVDEVGGDRAPGYGEWMAEQQRIEAKSLKSTREWREEQASEGRRTAKGATGKDDRDDEEDESKRKKNKKKKKKKDGGTGGGAAASTWVVLSAALDPTINGQQKSGTLLLRRITT